MLSRRGVRTGPLVAAGLAVLLGVPSSYARPPEQHDRYFRTPRAFPRTVADYHKRAQATRELEDMLAPAANGGANAAPARAPWVSAGPTNMNGRVTSIAADSTHPERLFAATVGGLWRSLDRGRTWERVSDAMRSGVWGAIATTPGTDEVLAGGGDPQMFDPSSAGGPGVWRSLHAGDPGSWEAAGLTKLDGGVTVRIRVDPSAPHDVYVASDQGVFRGKHEDDEIKWKRVSGFGRRCTDLAVDFSASPPVLYAAVYRSPRSSDNGIWKHSSGKWKKANTGIPVQQAGVIALALSPSSPSVLYAKVARDEDARLLGVYRTDTAAEPATASADAWRDITGNLRDDPAPIFTWFTSAIEVDPRDPSIVWLGDIGLYRGTVREEGDSPAAEWIDVTGGDAAEWGEKDAALHDDQHAIAFDPADPSVPIVGNDGGLDRLVRESGGSTHWEHISHGMNITEIHKIAVQRGMPTLIAAGVQDNGSAITFGNLTWYHQRAWDGGDIGVDAADALTTYQVCTDRVDMIVNPVPGTAEAFRFGVAPPGDFPEPPVAAHPLRPDFALSAGTRDAAGYQTLAVRRGSRAWAPLSFSPRFPTGTEFSAFGLAADDSMRTFYVGYRGRTGAASCIRATHDGGLTWIKGDGLPDLSPNRIEVDHRNPRRALAALGGGAGGSGAVMLTHDGGRYWHDISGTSVWRLPHTAVTGAVFDPVDSNVVYACTDVGVFRANVTPSAPPVAVWTPFSEGLPPAVSVNDIEINDAGNRLVIGTMGYGAYTRDLAATGAPPGVLLSIRDNVLDTGAGPAPSGVPDPERPVDPDGDHWYEPDASPEGALTSWCSPDIRVDVPARSPAPNRVEVVDHVAFESCAIAASRCPAGTILDLPPSAGDAARLFVQVTNRGSESARSVRVLALWAADGPAPPALPADFWQVTFAPEGAVGRLAAGSAWHFVDVDTPLRVLPEVVPGRPQVARFNWSVPAAGAAPKYLLAITDAPGAAIPDAVRDGGTVEVETLAPALSQIAVRRLRPVSVAADGQLWK